MHTQEIVDINMDAQNRRNRRRLVRIIVPIFAVVIILSAILAITLISYHNNRLDALILSKDLLKALDQRIATEVSTYLSPATDLVKLGAEIMKHRVMPHHVFEEQLTIELLKSHPQLAIFSFADSLGNFFMHTKKSDGAIHTKLIERKAEATLLTWIRRNPAGQVIKVEKSIDDSFDPRVRPWYLGAIKKRQIFWTDVYIFFTDQKPGITAAMPVIGSNGQIVGVVGLDIKLERLSAFLERLEIGQNGRALIINDQGALVAYPPMERMQVNNTLQPIMLNKLGDPVLNRAFNRFQIEGHGQRDLVVDGQRYLNTVSSLQSTIGRDWSVMILVPEDDFVGFVTKNIRTSLPMVVAVLAITSLLAALLVIQGLRADHHAHFVLERQHELEAQNRAFSKLASKIALFDPADNKFIGDLTKIVSETLGIRRISIWHLDVQRQQLSCSDSYDGESHGHTQATMLAQDDFPHLFETLLKGEQIIVADASHDPRTSELYKVYLHPLGCHSLLAIPIIHQDETVGAIWFEDDSKLRGWASEDINFAQTIASLLAIRISADFKHRNRPLHFAIDIDTQVKLAPARRRLDPRHEMPTTSIGGFYEQVSTREDIGADVFNEISILVLQFTDPISLATNLSESTIALDHLVCHLEELAIFYNIEYMKIMSNQIMCAACFYRNPNEQAALIADMALDIQEQCIHVFANLDVHMDFRIGIDKGAATGSPVGQRQKSYNLWGETVHTAAMMADSCLPGSIHVTESTYQSLKATHLFKVRGSYYLPSIGEISTYLLTGRI